MDDQKQQVAARVKEANNILVTVSANPSVDQLAACIGLTLALNKQGKHATAVFSGQVPSTIEFLQPEKTLEKNTDSLRDFIIALDKSKADKLRYKVEDTVVKIFITPYKTSITDKDLEFSQGDFNVDVVLAIGVHNQSDLDQAITAHGRILHDATVVTINTQPGGELGSINWLDPTSSSLSELTVQLVDQLDKSLFDTQIATAMLTGIVAETERFSNNKTTPRTMTLSAELMAAGANQQLVATKLEAPAPPPPPAPIATSDHHDQSKPIAPHEEAAIKKDDGTLEIIHDPKAEAAEREAKAAAEAATLDAEVAETEDNPADAPESSDPASTDMPPADTEAPVTDEPEADKSKAPQIHIDEHGSLSPLGLNAADGLPTISHHDQSLRMATTPPALGGALNATDMPESYDPSVDPLTQTTLGEGEAPMTAPAEATADKPPVGLTVTPPEDTDNPHADENALSMPYEALESEPPVSSSVAEPDNTPLTPRPDETLAEIEQDVHSSHLAEAAADNIIEPDLVLPPSQPNQPVTTLPEPSTPLQDLTLPMQSDAPGLDTTSSAGNDAFTMPELSQPAANPAPTDPTASLDSARDAVMDALNASSADGPLPPVAALNAQPVDLPLGHTLPAPDPMAPMPDAGMVAPRAADAAAYTPPPVVAPTWDASAPAPAFQPSFTADPAAPSNPMAPMPPVTVPDASWNQPDPNQAPMQQQADDPNAPPPVPPPMMPPTPPYSQPY